MIDAMTLSWFNTETRELGVRLAGVAAARAAETSPPHVHQIIHILADATADAEDGLYEERRLNQRPVQEMGHSIRRPWMKGASG